MTDDGGSAPIPFSIYTRRVISHLDKANAELALEQGGVLPPNQEVLRRVIFGHINDAIQTTRLMLSAQQTEEKTKCPTSTKNPPTAPAPSTVPSAAQ